MATSDAETHEAGEGEDSEIATARSAALAASGEGARTLDASALADMQRRLDERKESLSIEAERLRERLREVEQRETALRAHESVLAKRDATDPRVDNASDWDLPTNASDQEWNLPTLAASVEEARAMASRLEQKRTTPRPAASAAPARSAARPTPEARATTNPAIPTTTLGLFAYTVRQIAADNPIATFAAGFASAMLLMMILWGVM